ncbi:hypothetical protein CBER1_11523 [Cercospora berteroae]|uniref:Uncharacterized protein n=1 Tax=Cercospora berteroae TaxID=357750 RepID=A0A2S6CGS6_9PEZI|nr:hypothetical protein CBER1_11523 [Cercospora berteroae]
MAPTAGFLAQSESKKRFFDRLGLDERNKLHRHLYSNMKAEAVEGWSRISANRNALIPQLRDDPSIEPPYSFGQVDEEAVQEEVMHIFKNARRDTRIMYELGRDREGDVEENWIIRWLLWHVFRYRDDRNVAAGRRRTTADGDEADAASDATSEPASAADVVQAATLHAAATRNARSPPTTPHVPAPAPAPAPAPVAAPQQSHAEPPDPPGSVAGTRFFDPVRDAFRT